MKYVPFSNILLHLYQSQLYIGFTANYSFIIPVKQKLCNRAATIAVDPRSCYSIDGCVCKLWVTDKSIKFHKATMKGQRKESLTKGFLHELTLFSMIQPPCFWLEVVSIAAAMLLDDWPPPFHTSWLGMALNIKKTKNSSVQILRQRLVSLWYTAFCTSTKLCFKNLFGINVSRWNQVSLKTQSLKQKLAYQRDLSDSGWAVF